MGLFPSILYTISLEMAYFGINEIFQFDNNPLQNQEDRNVGEINTLGSFLE